MRRPDRSDMALLMLAAGTTAALTRPGFQGSWGDFVFGTLVICGVLLLVRMARRAHRLAGHEQDRARDVAGLEPGSIAAEAVCRERARMAVEIDATVRGSLHVVSDRVRRIGGGEDPVEGLRAVQQEARRAMTELRRELGLLRDDPDGSLYPSAGAASGRGTPDTSTPRPSGNTSHVSAHHVLPGRGDVLFTVLLLALAVVEMAALGWDEPPPGSAVPLASPVLTLALILGVLGQRVAPILAAWWMTALFTVSIAVDVPVVECLAYCMGYNVVMWRLASRPARSMTVLATSALAVAVVGSRLVHSPYNAPFNAVAIGVVVLTGWLVGRSRRAAARSHQAAEKGKALLRQVSDDAVRTERHVVACELHDIASHAISLIAVQAGAAEVLWAQGHPDAGDATQQLAATARRALTELDGLRPGADRPAVDWADVEALVHRMRTAGLDTAFGCDGTVPDWVVPTVYRVVQESLTNALRHAPAAPVAVEVTCHSDSVQVITCNGGPVPALARSGFGLVGLQERVTHAGGTVQAGPDGKGGFRVEVGLPSLRRADT